MIFRQAQGFLMLILPPIFNGPLMDLVALLLTVVLKMLHILQLMRIMLEAMLFLPFQPLPKVIALERQMSLTVSELLIHSLQTFK